MIAVVFFVLIEASFLFLIKVAFRNEPNTFFFLQPFFSVTLNTLTVTVIFLKSALMASPCPSTLAKEILANNPDLIIRETLYSADQERSNCRTLGPCFRGVASGILEVFITLRQGQEFLLLDEPRINWADWSGQKKPLKNWPTLFDGWTSWLNRVERAKADHWKRVVRSSATVSL